MKKKGLLAMGLAGVLTVGMCMPVLAATENNEFNQQNTVDGQDTVVTVTNPVVYSVSIPKNVVVNKDAGGTITVALGENAILGKDKAVVVKADTIVNKKLSLNSLENGDVVDLDVTIPQSLLLNNTNKEISYTLAYPTTFQYAGEYTGTVNFVIGYNGTEGMPEAPIS